MPNAKAHTVVHEAVPCAFARPHKGQIGTHTVSVVLDKQGGVISLGCECLSKHGENARAMHALDEGAQDDTCYAVLTEVHRTIRVLDEPSKKLPDALRATLGRASTLRQERQGDRLVYDWALNANERQSRALTKVANKVANSVLKLPRAYDVGNHSLRVETLVKQERLYAPIFAIEPVGGPNRQLYLMGDYHVVTGVPGQLGWELNKLQEDALRTQAKHFYSLSPSAYTMHVTNALQLESICVFCGETFDRPTRHTAGAAHADRVVNLAKLVLRATSRLGLQMLNNPRHRTAFIKD